MHSAGTVSSSLLPRPNLPETHWVTNEGEFRNERRTHRLNGGGGESSPYFVGTTMYYLATSYWSGLPSMKGW